MQYHRLFLFILLGLVLSLSACIDEDFSTSPQHTVYLSTDTVSFDTIFSTIGSTTKQVMVYNRNKVNLRITEIKLCGANDSPFRLNVDGRTTPNNRFTDVEIRANDSLYVFVEVTVDPTNNNMPVLIRDSVQLQVNGNIKKLQLQAYGQDVIIFKNKTIVNDTLLTNTKPYLIFGSLVVDTMKTLEIEAGSTLYFHDKGKLKVKGNLKAKGTLLQPIVFRGDRFGIMPEGTPYDNLSNQWTGIELTWTKAEHEMEYILLRNGNTGISIAGSETEQPKLSISNSRIYNFRKNGIAAKNAEVTIVNSEIANCGNYCLYLLGGTHHVIHTTIANFFKESSRFTPSVLLKNYLETATYPLHKADFKNCIVHGGNSTELILDKSTTDTNIPFNYTFKNCLIKTVQLTDVLFESTIWSKNTDSVFVSIKKPYNFMLYKNSPAINKANAVISSAYPTDILNNSRLSDSAPDMGAYEWIPEN
jgi:hypothetical protein